MTETDISPKTERAQLIQTIATDPLLLQLGSFCGGMGLAYASGAPSSVALAQGIGAFAGTSAGLIASARKNTIMEDFVRAVDGPYTNLDAVAARVINKCTGIVVAASIFGGVAGYVAAGKIPEGFWTEANNRITYLVRGETQKPVAPRP